MAQERDTGTGTRTLIYILLFLALLASIGYLVCLIGQYWYARATSNLDDITLDVPPNSGIVADKASGHVTDTNRTIKSLANWELAKNICGILAIVHFLFVLFILTYKVYSHRDQNNELAEAVFDIRSGAKRNQFDISNFTKSTLRTLPPRKEDSEILRQSSDELYEKIKSDCYRNRNPVSCNAAYNQANTVCNNDSNSYQCDDLRDLAEIAGGYDEF